jgi:SAM-dependent methyltransferase
MTLDAEIIQSLYRDDGVASNYVDERFSKPLGRVLHKMQIDSINSAIRSYQISHVLEVACGPARLTQEITGLTRGVALDGSFEMLKIAYQRLKDQNHWQLLLADAFNPGINHRFQLIYSFRFIRHFKLSSRIKLYKVFHANLEDNGILIFDAVHYEKIAAIRRLENRGQRVIYDKIYSNINELKSELDTAGFEFVSLKEAVRHFYLQAAVSRISHRLKRDEAGVRIITSLERYPFGCPLEWIVTFRKK